MVLVAAVCLWPSAAGDGGGSAQPGEVGGRAAFLPVHLLGVEKPGPGQDPAPLAQAPVIHLLWVELCPWSNSYVGFLPSSAFACALI